MTDNFDGDTMEHCAMIRKLLKIEESGIRYKEIDIRNTSSDSGKKSGPKGP